MTDIIEKSLDNSMSYLEYRKLMVDLLADGKSTGKNQTDELFNYSKLSNARMKRLDKTFRLSATTTESIGNLRKKYSWIVISESWCGDAAQILPVINKIVEVSQSIDLRIVLRDENEELMNKFLTNGSKSIPKLIVIEPDTREVLDTWGPRPSEATIMVNNHKEKFGLLDADFKKELQIWYNANKGINIVEDLMKLLGVTADCV